MNYILIASANDRFEYFCIASPPNCQGRNMILSFPFPRNKTMDVFFYCIHYSLQDPFYFVLHQAEKTQMVDSRCTFIRLDLRWMVPVFRFFEYVNFERKEQKVNSTS